MSKFDQLLEDARLTNILNAKGRIILLGLSHLSLEHGTSKESQVLSKKIFETVNGEKWLAGIMAVLFCFDMMLKDNPVSRENDLTDAEKEEFEQVIRNLFNNLGKGGKSDENAN